MVFTELKGWKNSTGRFWWEPSPISRRCGGETTSYLQHKHRVVQHLFDEFACRTLHLMMNLILCSWLGWWNWQSSSDVPQQMVQNSSYFFWITSFTMVSYCVFSAVWNIISYMFCCLPINFFNLPWPHCMLPVLNIAICASGKRGALFLPETARSPFAQKLPEFFFWDVKFGPFRIGANKFRDIKKHSNFKTH